MRKWASSVQTERKMADQLLRKITAKNYDSDQYVHELSVSSQGAVELQAVKQMVHSLAEETSGQLKRNVYKNYTQFIETAKEISYLESEMYQLSHMLTEQKALMASLLETSVLTNKPRAPATDKPEEKKVEEPKKTLTVLLEKVEGCASIVDVPGRHLVYSGELMEVDPNSFTDVNRVHAFLLNDSMVFATWIQNRTGPVKYKFQVLYELDSLPVVNVRDLPEVKNAFKILMFPEARLFVCENAKQKKDWLEIIESTKKAKRNVESARRESQLEVSTHLKEELLDTTNPFADDADDEEDSGLVTSATTTAFSDDESHPMSLELEAIPEWLLELPEDLDVCIAQRDFEEATNVIEKANDYIRSHPRVQQVKDMRPRIDLRVKILTEELQNELKVSPDKSLQGGPRAARRAVSLLVKLGKSTLACNLFLKHHSAVLKHSIKQLKIEGETRLYIKRLCNVFFTHIHDACQSLEQSFPGATATNNNAALVVWACNELKLFVATFSRQVFTPQVSLSLVADCVAVARSHCDQLADSGLDMTFLLNDMLKQDVERIFTESRDKLLEAVKLRAADDKWRALNHQNKVGLEKFLEDMSEIGIANIHSYVYDECWIALTSNTIQFSKAYLNFVDDALKLLTDDIHAMVDGSLRDIMRAQLKHVEASCKNEKFKNELKFIQKNGTFLANSILTLVERRYHERLGYSCEQLAKLHQTLTWLTGTGGFVTKYSTGGYL